MKTTQGLGLWSALVAMGSMALSCGNTALAADTSAIQDAEVRACIDRAIPGHTLKQQLTVQVIDSTDAARESSGVLYWKRGDDGLSKVFFRIEKSAQYQGVAVVMNEVPAGLEPTINMYSPELRRERRINSAALAGPLLGTDFSYEDFAQLQHIGTSGEVKRLPDADVDGHAAYVLETTPDPEASSYSRIQTALDKEMCLPMQTQFFAHNGKLLKEMSLDRAMVKKLGERWASYRVVMLNHKQNSRTVLVVDSAEADIEIPDSQFSNAVLRQGR